MINFAKHDEELHGIFKLVSGEEILAKAVLTDDNGETLCFISDPVMIQTITKEIDDTKVLRGMGFTKWMPMSDEEFYILREKDIMTIASMSSPVVLMYEAYIIGDDIAEARKGKRLVESAEAEGYLGTIDEARAKLEKIFKANS